jgi:hypothetical protein
MPTWWCRCCPRWQSTWRARLDLRKLHIVPNGIALDDGRLPARAPRRSRVTSTLAPGDGRVRRLARPAERARVLLDAAALCRDKLRSCLSDGTRGRLAARVRDEALTRAMFRRSRRRRSRACSQLDIAYIGWSCVPIYRFGIAPNKLMDYMMARRAVLHSVEAGNDRWPRAAAADGAARVAAAVADGLRALAARPPRARAMGERGRAFVLAHHTYPVLASAFIDAR